MATITPHQQTNPAEDEGGLTARTAQRLRERITSGVYPARTRLPLRKIAADLGVSPSTARTAVIRLSAAGDLHWQPRTTATVPTPPPIPANPHRARPGHGGGPAADRTTATVPLPSYPVRVEERHMT